MLLIQTQDPQIAAEMSFLSRPLPPQCDFVEELKQHILCLSRCTFVLLNYSLISVRNLGVSGGVQMKLFHLSAITLALISAIHFCFPSGKIALQKKVNFFF